MRTAEETVRALWRSFDEGRFEAVRDLLSEDFVADWPQTRERIRGADNFIALNANYPGRWRCRVERIVVTGDEAISLVEISDPSHRLYAVSFFTFAGGRIESAREFFGDCGAPPFERGQWTERY